MEERTSGRKGGRKPAQREPTAAQLAWLRRGLDQPGGKLPLFDEAGQRVSSGLVRTCVRAGWAEPWFNNPLKPSWEVCRLTEVGRAMLANVTVVKVDFGAARRRRRAASDTASSGDAGPVRLPHRGGSG